MDIKERLVELILKMNAKILTAISGIFAVMTKLVEYGDWILWALSAIAAILAIIHYYYAIKLKRVELKIKKLQIETENQKLWAQVEQNKGG